MRAKFVSENIKFERGQDPKNAMNIGLAPQLAKRTSDAYSFDRYGEDEWLKITSYMLETLSEEWVEWILRSKHMRWAGDFMEDQGHKLGLKGFELYISGDINRIKSDLENPKLLQEMDGGGAMGGVSAPMSTLNNTPGVGNVQPGSGTDGIGSGDNFGNNIGTYTQDGKLKKKKKKKKKARKIEEENVNPHDKLGTAMAKKMDVDLPFEKGKGDQDVKQKKIDEMNINPYDPVGVAMAKKLGAALPFVKGKGDKDVEQLRIDKDIDLDTDKNGMMSIEDWQKQFLGE